MGFWGWIVVALIGLFALGPWVLITTVGAAREPQTLDTWRSRPARALRRRHPSFSGTGGTGDS